MRPRPRLSILAALTTLTATALPLLAAPAPANAVTCKAPSTLLHRTYKASALAGGASMRVWDTGPTPSNPLASLRIVAVRIPKASSIVPTIVTAGALTKRATVGTYAGRVATSVAAINGAIFDPVTGGVSQRSMTLQARAVKANSAWDAMLTRGSDGTLGIDRYRLTGTVTVGTRTLGATGLNWGSVSGSGVNVWTRDWGTARRPYGLVDVVVYGGKVAAVRTGTARGYAPGSGQVILSANGTAGEQLAAARVGQPVTLGYRIASWDGKTPYQALGRGKLYVNGSTLDGGSCTTRDEQLRPRSAIAWLANGDVLAVSVSGRAVINGVQYGGATIHQMPTYLKELGAVRAIGLDGGGSTTLMVRTRPSYAPIRVDKVEKVTQRAVPDAVVWYAR